MGVPGPKPWPLIGNFPYVIKYGMTRDVCLVKKFGRIFGYFEGMIPVLFIADIECIKQITVRDFDKFRNRRNIFGQEELSKSVSFLEDEEWKLIRNIITPTFTSGKLKKIVRLIDDCAKRMNHRLQERLVGNDNIEVNTKEECSSFTISVLAETLFGVRMDDDLEKTQLFAQKSKKAFEEFNVLNPLLLLCYIFPSTKRILEKLGVGLISRDSMNFYKTQVLSIIELRRKTVQKSNDFLQLLIDARASDKTNEDDQTTAIDRNKWQNVKKRTLSEEEIVANCVLFFLAGFETTTLTVAWVLHLLSIHQDVQRKLFKEINVNIPKNEPLSLESISKLHYLEQVIHETLRIFSVANRIDRICNEDCLVGPYHVPKGMVINIGVKAVHMDEEYWQDPSQFDPERFSPERQHEILPYSYFPFGLGPRNCIAMRLALLEVKICIVRIIEEFKISRSLKTELDSTGAGSRLLEYSRKKSSGKFCIKSLSSFSVSLPYRSSGATLDKLLISFTRMHNFLPDDPNPTKDISNCSSLSSLQCDSRINCSISLFVLLLMVLLGLLF